MQGQKRIYYKLYYGSYLRELIYRRSSWVKAPGPPHKSIKVVELKVDNRLTLSSICGFSLFKLTVQRYDIKGQKLGKTCKSLSPALFQNLLLPFLSCGNRESRALWYMNNMHMERTKEAIYVKVLYIINLSKSLSTSENGSKIPIVNGRVTCIEYMIHSVLLLPKSLGWIKKTLSD